jgi:PAS domain S-box-containing protein
MVVEQPQAVLAAAAQAYLAVDAGERVAGWNPAAEHVFGCRRELVCGRSLEELIVPVRVGRRCRLWPMPR